MQGQQQYQHQLFHYFDIDSLIPQNHLLRRINKFVDLSFVRELTEPFYCPNNGRPSIDPEVFFRIVLIGYFYNIQSDRQICEEIQYNLAYRWFCKLSLEDKTPDHSSLTKIRDRLGLDVFQHFFNKIVEQCKQHGLVQNGSVMTDGTLINANASIDSLIPKEPIEIKKEKTEEQETTTSAQSKRKISNKTHVSSTDPDATLAFKKGKSQNLKYKAHMTIDSESRVVLDTKITTGAYHDSQAYLEQLDSIIDTFGVSIDNAIADRAYGGGEILQSLIDRNIEPIIPLFSKKSGSIVNEEDGFIYEEELDRYRCLAGNYLTRFPSPLADGRLPYRLSGKVCKKCPLQESCKANVVKHHMRIIRRSPYQKLFEIIAAKMKTTNFCQKMTERFWKMEGTISEAKNRHCLSRAKYRGLKKMQIQAYLSTSVQNMKRLVIAFLYLLFYSLCIRKLAIKTLTKFQGNNHFLKNVVFQQPRAK